MKWRRIWPVLAVLLIAMGISFFQSKENQFGPNRETVVYNGDLYVTVNNNEPDFKEEELNAEPYEFYSELDRFGRCGYAMACLSKELMPTDERTGIGHIKPSGWQSVQYDFIDGKYLYNRSHLIGFQLAGENDNEKNLITGTRYFNATGMLAFENMVADYIKETGNRVLYRVTPEYTDSDLVAYAVRMEAKSIEDNGEGICFHVLVYNVQPGVIIDYKTGESKVDEEYFNKDAESFVLNTNSKRFHKPTCSDAASMKAENRQEVFTARELLTAQGYKPCGSCDP
jgi:DNA-entry nuclease